MFFSPKTTVKIPLQLYTVTYSGHKNKTAFMTVLQATDRGLEPLLTESESAVLPLHQSASFLFLSDSTFTLYRNFSKSQALFLFFKQSKNFNLFFDKNSILLFCTKHMYCYCIICFFFFIKYIFHSALYLFSCTTIKLALFPAVLLSLSSS